MDWRIPKHHLESFTCTCHQCCHMLGWRLSQGMLLLPHSLLQPGCNFQGNLRHQKNRKLANRWYHLSRYRFLTFLCPRRFRNLWEAAGSRLKIEWCGHARVPQYMSCVGVQTFRTVFRARSRSPQPETPLYRHNIFYSSWFTRVFQGMIALLGSLCCGPLQQPGAQSMRQVSPDQPCMRVNWSYGSNSCCWSVHAHHLHTCSGLHAQKLFSPCMACTPCALRTPQLQQWFKTSKELMIISVLHVSE